MPTLHVTSGLGRGRPDRGRGPANAPYIIAAPYPGADPATGTVHLPPLSEQEQAAVVGRFNGCVTALSLLNRKRPAWWFSWLSSRDQHNNTLFRDLLFLRRLEKLLGTDLGWPTLAIEIDRPALADAAAELARSSGWRVATAAGDRVRWWWLRCRERLTPLTDAARVLRLGLRLVAAARRHPARKPVADVLMVTLLHDSVLRLGDGYRDVYLGTLHAHLAEQGETVLVLGHAQGNIEAITAKVASFPAPAIATTGHFLEWADAPAVAWNAFRRRFRRDCPTEPSTAFRALMDESLARVVTHLGLAMYMARAVARALAGSPGARIIRIYENNPWERGVDRAARHAGAGPIAGFLHCAVLPAHLKNTFAEAERPFMPRPDRIICTGTAARDVFMRLGPHEPDHVFAGCNLRGPDISTLPARPKRNAELRTCLVLLEGLDKMQAFLRFIDAAARLAPARHFVVRAHPAMPLTVLAPAAGVAVGPGAALTGSDIAELEDDLSRADVVVYQGSTAVMSAAVMGIPMIRFDNGERPTDDPLLECGALKETARTPVELINALAAFETRSEEEMANAAAKARAYVLQYLTPPTPESMSPFTAPAPL